MRAPPPAPKPIAIGRLPISAAMVVIMIGRKRIRPAWWIACSARMPSLRCASMAKSIIMMAFFFTMPISMMMPTKAYMLSSMPKASSVTSAPRPAVGRPERMVSGWMKLSYRMPSTR